MTILAEKLKEAGVHRDVIYLAAVEALKRADGNFERALARLREALVIAQRDMKSGGRDYRDDAATGQTSIIPPPDPETASELGQRWSADEATEAIPAPRGDTSPTDAGRVLRRQPGSGAMQPRAYQTRMEVRGQSWLLSHRWAVNDRPWQEITAGELHAMGHRIARDGANLVRDLVLCYAADALVIKRQLSPDQRLDRTLTPADIMEIEQMVDAPATVAKAKNWIKDVARKQLAHAES